MIWCMNLYYNLLLFMKYEMLEYGDFGVWIFTVIDYCSFEYEK